MFSFIEKKFAYFVTLAITEERYNNVSLSNRVILNKHTVS